MKKWLFAFLLVPLWVEGCTGILLKAQDGSVVHARTLEFGANTLQSNVLSIPRGTKYQGTTPKGSTGITWEAKYAIIGANAFDYPQIIDGLNEAGLAVGLFYFPGFAEYSEFTRQSEGQSLAPWELGTYILSQFRSVDEVKKGVQNVRVVSVTLPQFGYTPPLHYVVHDKTGKSIVIEPTGGELLVYDNPFGVVTNSPGFPWHITNLRNYINLTPDNMHPIEVDGAKLSQLGQGSGLRGLPGDFTSPSRFIRAAVFSSVPFKLAGAEDAVLHAFHILNQFDIPPGAVVETEGAHKGDYEVTLFTSASDLNHRRFFFHTLNDRTIRVLEMSQVDPQGQVQIAPMEGAPSAINIAPELRNLASSSP